MPKSTKLKPNFASKIVLFYQQAIVDSRAKTATDFRHMEIPTYSHACRHQPIMLFSAHYAMLQCLRISPKMLKIMVTIRVNIGQ